MPVLHFLYTYINVYTYTAYVCWAALATPTDLLCLYGLTLCVWLFVRLSFRIFAAVKQQCFRLTKFSAHFWSSFLLPILVNRCVRMCVCVCRGILQPHIVLALSLLFITSLAAALMYLAVRYRQCVKRKNAGNNNILIPIICAYIQTCK